MLPLPRASALARSFVYTLAYTVYTFVYTLAYTPAWAAAHSSIAPSEQGLEALQVSIAPWKGDAKAAYTLTMDDFCEAGARGIAAHADSLLHNRGLTMGFGAIAGSCDAEEWGIAKRMLSHGHEVLNHSWTHGCPKPETWCEGKAWEGERLAQEVDSAAKAIRTHLGIQPSFYLFPFDNYLPAHLEYLKSKGYLGARAGRSRGINPPGQLDPFDLAFDAVHPSANKQWQGYSLNGLVDSALGMGGWALRETHGVADGSYGSLSVAEFRAHLDHVKKKVDSGLLWMAPPSMVLKYIKAKSAAPVVESEAHPQARPGRKSYWIRWPSGNASANIPLTLKLTGLGALQLVSATQAGVSLPTRSSPGVILFDCRPDLGPVRVFLSASNPD